MGGALAVEDSGGDLEPATAEVFVFGQEAEGVGVEGAEFGWGVEGECQEAPVGIVGWRGGFEVQDGCALGLEGGGGFGVGGTGEELGQDSTLEDFVQEGFGIALEAYGEGAVLAEFVLHGAEGFVEGVDDEVAGSVAGCIAEEGGVRFESEADGSGNGGGEGEGCAGFVQADVEN